MASVGNKKALALALRRKEDMLRIQCFDPRDLSSRPTDIQEEVLQDINHVSQRFCLGGNQCQPEGTLVLTPQGLVEIQDLRPGDVVYDENGREIEVEANYKNGKQKVVELLNRGMVWGESTLNHVWLTTNSSKGGEAELPVEAFKRDTQVVRRTVKAPLGEVRPHAPYALGALLGDGCSRERSLSISSSDKEVVTKVAQDLGAEYKRAHPDNYTWKLSGGDLPDHYTDWASGRYAHEKMADLAQIRTWDRNSLLEYTAGLIDTDGSVFLDSWDNVVITCSMQALPVIESLQYAFLALWQAPTSITIDNRTKYVNGPCYAIKLANNAFSLEALRELSDHLQVPRKKWKSEYDNLVSRRTSSDRIGVKLGAVREAETYDIRVKSPRNLYLTATGLVTHNSGKTATGGRECAWLFTNTHPSWAKKPDRPLLMLVLGISHKVIREEIWASKIKPFLREGDYKLYKDGTALSHAKHKNGNTILFFSHNSPEECRESLQGIIADWVWLDEMPGSYKLLTELAARCYANSAPLLATFTPLLRNAEIKNHIENGDPKYTRKYILKTYDNPTYTDEQLQEIKYQHSLMSENERRTRSEGSWYAGDLAVYDFSTNLHTAIPPEYHPSWRHVEAVDPAGSGKAGYALLAENPADGVWYVIKAEYIDGNAASVLLDKIQKLTQNVNCVKKVADPHEAWFIKEAGMRHQWYEIPHKKNERKKELIKGLQEALYNGRLKVAPWCKSAIDEFITCQWSQTSDKIVNARSFHLMDCLQYAVDCLPKYEKHGPVKTIHAMMKEKNRQRIAREAAKKRSAEAKRARLYRPKMSKKRKRIWGI